MLNFLFVRPAPISATSEKFCLRCRTSTINLKLFGTLPFGNGDGAANLDLRLNRRTARLQAYLFRRGFIGQLSKRAWNLIVESHDGRERELFFQFKIGKLKIRKSKSATVTNATEKSENLFRRLRIDYKIFINRWYGAGCRRFKFI